MKLIRPFAFLLLLAATEAAALPSPEEEARVLEAIRSGKLQITDELIESQRLLHPELRGRSNAEIRNRLEERARAAAPEDSALEDAKRPDPKASAKAEPPPQPPRPSGESTRFPSGIERFGYDFFRNNANTGAGGGNAPALPEYILSAGDEIQIYAWGRENRNQTIVIDNEGMFHYPPLEPIRLAGMRFADAQSLLVRELEKINGLKASVGLGRLKSIRVFVLGEAIKPGSYVVPAGATVTSALFQSGGIREIGSLRAIQLKRNGRVAATLDLYEMLLKGNNRTDQQLLPGDVIFVPVAPIQAAVTGKVKRPGIYEVKPGTKVLEALELAGGLSSNAFKGRVRLDRIENHKRKIALDIPMEQMGRSSNTTLQDGDILHVEEVLAREYDVVYLEGNVNRPGRYEFRKGMTIRDVIPGVKDLKSETFFSYGHIKRSTDDEQGSILLPFSLTDVFEKGASVPLQPRDTVIVYSRFDIMDQPEVRVAGLVRRPGSYPFVDQMRVSDLIIAGGGLTDGAYLPEAHLIRLLRIEESDSLYSTLLKLNLSNLIGNPGDPNNAELRPSDSLIIFPRSNFILPKSVSIFGAVKTNGDYELTQNMGIPELISQAQGATKNAYILRVEVVRRVLKRDSVVSREIHHLNLRDVIEGRKTFPLQDGDAVYVREVVDNRAGLYVVLTGEFNFPGRYEVAKDERLSSVIRRAGGFTEDAYLRGLVFSRRRVREQQIRMIDELDRRLQQQALMLKTQTTNEKDRQSIDLAIEQRKSILADARNAPFLGRVVVDVDRELTFAGETEDITLETGDSLHVGRSPSTVSILGEVFTPTSVIFGSENNTIRECLAKAGGISEYGDQGNVHYIKPDGTVLTPKNTSFFKSRGVEPGGTIIVPPKGPRKDYLDALGKISQVIYQIAISVGVAVTLL